MIRRWPKSLPDYRWPAAYGAAKFKAVRIALAGVFHAAHAVGRAVGLAFHRGDERVLIIRTDGIGDALLFEPAIESLGRVLSPRQIHLWAPKLSCDLFVHNPAISRLMSVPRGFKQGNLLYFSSLLWRAKLGFELGRWKFDKVIYPVESPEPLGNWLFESARANERWINSGDESNQFDWQRSRTQESATRILEARPGNSHELTRLDYIAAQWGENKPLRRPKVYLTPEMIERADRQVELWCSAARKIGSTDQLIGVIPAASTPIKHFPEEKWAAALGQLWHEHRTMSVLIGGACDASAIDHLAQVLTAASVPFLRLEKPGSILENAALVSKLDGAISVDTGLAHLAVAQGAATLVLCGAAHPSRFFPWPGVENHATLSVSVPCSGCNNRCSQDEPICITQIEPSEIAAAYARLKGWESPVEVYVAATINGQPNKLQAAG